MKRPLLYWVISFVLGEVFIGIMPKYCMVIVAVLWIVILMYLSCDYIKKNRRLLLFGVLFFLLGVVNVIYWNGKCEICKDFTAGNSVLEFCGRVIEKEEKNGGSSYTIRCSRINDKAFSTDILITYNANIIPGSYIEGKGRCVDFFRATNPGQYDEKAYRSSMGIFIKLDNVKISMVREPAIKVRQTLYEIRCAASSVLQSYLGETDYSIARAMLLGEKSDMDKEIKELYRRNGIAHLLAISGLHIAMLGGGIYHLFRKMSGRYSIAAVTGCAFIVSYGMLTGLSGATVRAMIMLMLAIGADVFGRSYDAMTGLSLALIIMLLVNPLQVGQAGFLLSFGAVIGITCVYPVINECVMTVMAEKNDDNKTKKKRKKRGILSGMIDGLLISISVSVVTAPVLLYFYYEIPLYSVILNVVVVPLMSVLLAGLLLTEISGFMTSVFLSSDHVVMAGLGRGFKLAAGLSAKVAETVFFIYKKLCGAVERLPFHTVCTGRPEKSVIIAYYLAVFLVIIFIKMKWYKLCLMPLIVLALLTVGAFIQNDIKICIFDVGQGDGIFIKMPHNDCVLIDGGSSSKKNVGEYVLKNGIRYYGCRHLKYSIVTHADSDHYSGVIELLKAPDIIIDNFVLPDIKNPDETYITLCEAAKEKGCNVIRLKKGDKLLMGDTAFICLNPEYREYADKNTGSIVLLMKYKAFDMLLTGDMDEEAEKTVISDGLIDRYQKDGAVDVLKVSHHGSKTASSAEFLKAYDFGTAIVSVGKDNHFGHPAPVVMERLESFCKRIYLTKDSGAITIETDGRSYRISEYDRVGKVK